MELERMALEDKIRTLYIIVEKKEQQLTSREFKIDEEHLKQQELLLAKSRLQEAVGVLEKKFQG